MANYLLKHIDARLVVVDFDAAQLDPLPLVLLLL
jgi:hypothetical protein